MKQRRCTMSRDYITMMNADFETFMGNIATRNETGCPSIIIKGNDRACNGNILASLKPLTSRFKGRIVQFYAQYSGM